MDERRQYVRLDAQLNVTYTVLSQAKRANAVAKDVGGGGVCFMTNEPLALGTRVRIEITLPGKEPIPFTGEVVWSGQYQVSSTLQRGRSFEVRVRIVEISPADREVLKRYVSLNL